MFYVLKYYCEREFTRAKEQSKKAYILFACCYFITNIILWPEEKYILICNYKYYLWNNDVVIYYKQLLTRNLNFTKILKMELPISSDITKETLISLL